RKATFQSTGMKARASVGWRCCEGIFLLGTGDNGGIAGGNNLPFHCATDQLPVLGGQLRPFVTANRLRVALETLPYPLELNRARNERLDARAVARRGAPSAIRPLENAIYLAARGRDRQDRLSRSQVFKKFPGQADFVGHSEQQVIRRFYVAQGLA